MREKFGHLTVSEMYGALLQHLVEPETHWIDVGGGSAVLPSNLELSAQLVQRSARFVVVDPSVNVMSHPHAQERHQCLIEDYQGEGGFSLATLRMVAEHVENPPSVARTLARLVKVDGVVAVLTPNKWSPASVIANLVPNSWHPFFTNLMSGRAAEDTFPTVYAMNTKKALNRVFHDAGFVEERFYYLDDCSVLQRFHAIFLAQLAICWLSRSLGVPFPENVLLGLYRRR